jgi:hypothetical protein
MSGQHGTRIASGATTMKKPTIVLRNSITFPATFIVSALALAACDPVPPCRGEIELGATYQVSLVGKSTPVLYATGGREDPSCMGLDRLESGFALDIAIPLDGPHPQYDEGGCWVPQGDLTSDVGLPLVPIDGLAGFGIYYNARPMFVRSAKFSIGDCAGGWSFMTVDEADHGATSAHRWAGRLAWLELTPACEAAYPAIVSPTNGWCYDEWDVDLQVK